ncbi:hypothetical protein DJICPGNB_25930 [Escherichia coli]|nr:hypothetical protein DJICPGNB_25930 [Escherichia coli]
MCFGAGNTVFDDMAMPLESSVGRYMLEELADKLENKTVKDSELIQELRRVMNKIYAMHDDLSLADFIDRIV